MSILSYLNPFNWFPEDPVTRCGWYMLRLRGGKPEDDPYFDFCAIDDRATSEGSFASKVVPLDRWIQGGIDMINEIQKQFEPGSEDWELGERYKAIWPHVVGLFWSGKE